MALNQPESYCYISKGGMRAFISQRKPSKYHVEEIWVKDQLQLAWYTGLSLPMNELFDMIIRKFTCGPLYDQHLSKHDAYKKTARQWLRRAVNNVNFSQRRESIGQKSSLNGERWWRAEQSDYEKHSPRQK